MFLVGIIYYLRIDICHTLQRWEESYAPIPNSGNGANWTCQGMACIYLPAKKGKCLWLPLAPAAKQTVLSCSLHPRRSVFAAPCTSRVEDDSWFRENGSISAVKTAALFCTSSATAVLIPGTHSCHCKSLLPRLSVNTHVW